MQFTSQLKLESPLELFIMNFIEWLTVLEQLPFYKWNNANILERSNIRLETFVATRTVIEIEETHEFSTQVWLVVVCVQCPVNYRHLGSLFRVLYSGKSV